MGRGVIATAPFLKNEVVFDYHGIEVEGHTVDSYCQTNPDLVKPEYIIEVKQDRRRLIDASEDPCAWQGWHTTPLQRMKRADSTRVATCSLKKLHAASYKTKNKLLC